MSTNTGVAPTLWIVPAVAKKVNGVVITSSPRPTSSARMREQDRVGAVRAADGVPRVRQLGDRRFELRHGVAEDEGLRVDDLHHRGDDVVADGGVLGLEIEKRNGHDESVEWTQWPC